MQRFRAPRQPWGEASLMRNRPGGFAAILLAAVLLLARISACAAAEPLDVTIGYQTNVTPAQAAISEHAYERASGAAIDWRKFDSGSDVVAAMASGDVQIGYAGSSPATTAFSKHLPLEVFYVAQLTGTDEALVIRNGSGISNPAGLVGRKIATPFISTSHYALLGALRHWRIDPKTVQILNLRPPEITAAWLRGDIDGAYVWDPALTRLRASGTMLASSTDVAKWGTPTFDVWLVRKSFATAHPDFVAKFAQVTSDYDAAYRSHPESFSATSAHAAAIAKITGVPAGDIPAQLTEASWPTAVELATPAMLDGGIAKQVAATAGFLKDQGKIYAVLPSYAPYVTADFVKPTTTPR